MAICADLRPASAACGVVVDRGVGRDRVFDSRQRRGWKRPRPAGSTHLGVGNRSGVLVRCRIELVLRGRAAVLYSQRRPGDGCSRAIGGLRLAERWPDVPAGAGLSSASPGMARDNDAGDVRAAELGAASCSRLGAAHNGSDRVALFRGADLLHLARLGAYASLAEDDAHPVPDPEASNPPDLALAPEPDQPPEIMPAADQV